MSSDEEMEAYDKQMLAHFKLAEQRALPDGVIKAGDICARAASLVAGDRAATHGDLVETHDNIAALWSAYLGVPISAKQVALMMALLKIARTKNGALNPDDYVDLAGYAGIAGEIARRK